VGKRRMPHTPSMFPQSFQQYAPVVPACIAYLTFEAFLFPRAEPLPKVRAVKNIARCMSEL
jgi:hypothetical protein